MYKPFFKTGRQFGNWELTSYLDGGGNGEVWRCKNTVGDEWAIKLLRSIRAKPYERFKDETTIIENNSDIQGILP